MLLYLKFIIMYFFLRKELDLEIKVFIYFKIDKMDLIFNSCVF